MEKPNTRRKKAKTEGFPISNDLRAVLRCSGTGNSAMQTNFSDHP